jgi:NADH-quinone oxidoreductase subunit H
VTTLLVILTLVVGAYLVAVLEAWVSTGSFRLAGPVVSAVALLGRESLVPRKPDRIFFEVAPPLLLVSSVLALAVLPLAPGLIVADLATGALFVNAALVYVMVALVMAGWGPNGAYAMVAGWRFLGQLLGYSMPIVMAIAAIAMRAESLMTTRVVDPQAPCGTRSTSPSASSCSSWRPWPSLSCLPSTCPRPRASSRAAWRPSTRDGARRSFAWRARS